MTKPFFLGVVGVYILQCVHARGLHDIERQPLAYRDIKSSTKEKFPEDGTYVGEPFDVAISHNPHRHGKGLKYREDTRELKIKDNGDFLEKEPLVLDFDKVNEIALQESSDTNHDLDIVIEEGGTRVVTPMPPVPLIDIGTQGLVVSENDDDDVDIGSGSGAHEDFVMEEGTVKVNKTIDGDYWFIEENSDIETEEQSESSLPKFCEKDKEITWASWSPWLQLGDRDFRFRRCQRNGRHVTLSTDCVGESYEVRQCLYEDERLCRLSNETVTEEFKIQCQGINLADLDIAGYLSPSTELEDDCEYELFDMTYKMAIGSPLTTRQLQSADPSIWCTEGDIFVPFYTPKAKCLQILKAFCKRSNTCSYDISRDNDLAKNDLTKLCWQEHVLDGIFPEGLPSSEHNHVICQKFDKKSQHGKIFGVNNAYFVTLYDTARRMPVVSAVKTTSVGSDKWPAVSLMIEQGLLRESSSTVVSWLFKDKKNGMAPFDDVVLKQRAPLCELGEFQALPTDFDHSSYIPTPLISPGLVGNDLGARISTFTMTNMVPLEPTLVTYWKNALVRVESYMRETCTGSVGSPEIFILSGTAADNATSIGNGVTVPEIVWMSVCCVVDNEVSSFAIYANNQFGERPYQASVSDLQSVLRSKLSTQSAEVSLFPGNDNACSLASNHVSFAI